ncbi:hypothetical protein G6F42_026910 [Rhizopus arrhizus]|nr:hypothetical protein G6F42_026910 [Rhizopus arrhizus]
MVLMSAWQLSSLKASGILVPLDPIVGTQQKHSMNGLPEFREYCLSRTSLNSILAKSPQPRKSVDTPRRTGGTSMDDLVPQRPQRRSSKRPPAVSNSPQSTVQSPPSMSHAHQSMYASAIYIKC